MVYKAVVRVLEGLGMPEEAAMFCLAMPDEVKACGILTTAMQLKALDPYAVDFFLRYFTHISPNF